LAFVDRLPASDEQRLKPIRRQPRAEVDDLAARLDPPEGCNLGATPGGLPGGPPAPSIAGIAGQQRIGRDGNRRQAQGETAALRT
jgi:hypothetical protein